MLLKQLKEILRTTSGHLNKLKDIGVTTVRDLLLYFPRTYTDRSDLTKIVDLSTEEVNTVKGILTHLSTIRTRNGKFITKGMLTDDTGTVEVVWFNQPHLKRILYNEAEVVLMGKAKYAYGRLSLLSPSYELLKNEMVHSERIVPVYHETEGITSKWIREKIKPLIDDWAGGFEEYLPDEIIKNHNLLSYSDSVKNIHFPESEETLKKAVERLSFDELFLLQLKALQKKWYWQKISSKDEKKIPQNIDLIKEFLSKLPFDLTNAQKKTLAEILRDLENPYPMHRLVQGDVGSGKTVVAAAAILNTVKAGFQCALMAPTEILAKQHYQTLAKFLLPYGINIQFISGSTTQKNKDEIISQMKKGTVDLVIGTHALIQEKINFKKLGLAVIDEQHRFGVKQRTILKSFGSPHLLSLSATPIPRTLAMTIYGDQDLSVIDELPKGRQEIITRVVPENKRIDAYRWIEDQVRKGRQVFVICPLIDESDVLGVKAVTKEYDYLSEHIFPQFKIGLLHGKLKPADKEQIMKDFKDNKINVLVSTSVVEVGIDVPNATIMLIEGAERFGLSQLHQFRGRVGRGEHQSYCFLFPTSESEDSKKRLSAMVSHSSGFKLAEIDLNLRGPGEIYGIKQSGIPDLKMASLTDSITIEKARIEAQKIIEEDPELLKYPELQEKLKQETDVFVQD
ncbi:ATP-dependent DNA helicase RecG [Candidatus Peregrinibacteria bacterium]|nr:ATP-dependent DNA helicase RecG [Candidatus Peregrinibacteria bacterium]